MKYAAMLASPLESAPKSLAIVEPKLDGVRALYQGDRLYKRGGGPITPPSIIKALKAHFPGLYLDGEIVSDTFGGAISVMTSKKEGEYHIFDLLERNGKPTVGWSLRDRREALDTAFDEAGLPQDSPIKLVPYQYASDIEKQAKAYVEAGYEGAMVKLLDAPYLPGIRSKVWSKRKYVREFDGTVIGATEGDNNFVGTLGALVVQEDGGVVHKIGGKMSMEQRQDFWKRHQAGDLTGTRITALVQNDNSAVESRFGRFVKEIRERVDL